MKKFISALICFLCLMVMLAMAGCTNTKPITNITEFERFSDMQQTSDVIDVEFDNHTGKPFNFTINNKSDIQEIMNIVLTEELVDIGKDFPPGDNTFITIHQGEKSYNLSTRINSENGSNYAFSTDKLQSKIIDLATIQGAYDTLMGVVYKVMDLSEIESEKSLVGNNYDNTALLDLIEADIKADYRFVCLLETESKTVVYYNLTLSDSHTYTDRVTMADGKLLVLYEIYQKYDTTSYYIVDALPMTTNIPSSYMEFILGSYYSYIVKVNIVS